DRRVRGVGHALRDGAGCQDGQARGRPVEVGTKPTRRARGRRPARRQPRGSGAAGPAAGEPALTPFGVSHPAYRVTRFEMLHRRRPPLSQIAGVAAVFLAVAVFLSMVRGAGSGPAALEWITIVFGAAGGGLAMLGSDRLELLVAADGCLGIAVLAGLFGW